ncbi:hypothetical protein ASG91_19085 [Phycicoccus sp. Soil802]|nr:hypothetical protein ASG91_19085 [Phycicoccus sp. Soil802]
MVASSWSDIDDGLLNPEWYAAGEPHDAFTLLRQEDPVHWAQPSDYGRPFWAVTTYEHVVGVLNDPGNFSNYRDTKPPRVAARLTASELYQRGTDVFLTHLDPPLHTLHRQPVEGHFQAASISTMRADVEAVVDELLGTAALHDRFDLMQGPAADMPMYVLMRFLGVPRDDWEWLRSQVSRIFTPDDPEYAVEGRSAEEIVSDARHAIADYSAQLARTKRSHPADDFGSLLARTVVDGTRLDDHETGAWLSLLLAAGIATTRNTAVAALWLLHQNPAQRAALAAQPALIDQAVEEVLRWITPVRSRLRVARFDTTIGDRRISAGDWVVPFLSSANRDETVFADPHAFDIQRERKSHVSLGEGIHKCLGMHLVRLELGVFLTKFLAQFPHFSIPNADQPQWIVDHVLNGFSTMQVELRPR